MDMLGVSFVDGILVQQTKDYAQNLIVGDIAYESVKVSKGFASAIAKKNNIVGMDAMALDASKAADRGFEVINLVTTDSLSNDKRRVWNELQVTDFENEKAVFDPEKGERELKNAPVALALTRKVADKDQRIVVLGNADMIANVELMQSRSGVRASNYTLITESFRYLSQDEFPIFAPRPAGPDTNLLYIKREARVWFKWIFNFIIPGLIALFGIFLLIRRKSR
jgi:ABC-2 type transport system permease protein